VALGYIAKCACTRDLGNHPPPFVFFRTGLGTPAIECEKCYAKFKSVFPERIIISQDEYEALKIISE
jgi:hypothetical protein